MSDKEFEEYNAAQRQKQEDTDRDHHQNEVAEREIGQRPRFMAGGEKPAVRKEKEEKDRCYVLTALAELMQDPEYAALYKSVSDQITSIAKIVEDEITLAEKKLQTLNDQKSDMLRDANRIDGKAVFKDESGNVFTEDGEQITDPVKLKSLVWKDDMPAHEKFTENEESIKTVTDTLGALTSYQVDVIGTAKNRLENEDDPPSKKELRQIKESVVEAAPEAVKQRLEQETAVHTHDTAPQETAAFKMN